MNVNVCYPILFSSARGQPYVLIMLCSVSGLTPGHLILKGPTVEFYTYLLQTILHLVSQEENLKT